tara:strand:- start:53 stop:637 length:585 start_codon:yes stop_codon:yes gene_type:complete
MTKIFIKIIFIILLCFPANSEIKRISEGDINAKIKIIVYESLTCSHCADFHKNVYPKLKEEFIETGRVFIEYRNFPLNLAALNAAKIAHCKNNGKTEVLHFLFKNYDNWVNGSTMEELNNNLNILIKKQYLNIDFDKCLENKKIENFILEDRIEAVKKFEINATPTIIINNEKFRKSLTFKNLKKYLENTDISN